MSFLSLSFGFQTGYFIPPPPASVVWGDIGGNIDDQIDLQEEFATKFDNPTGDESQYIMGNGQLATFPTIPDVSGLVPYNGADEDVDLGNHTLTATNFYSIANKATSATTMGIAYFDMDGKIHSDPPDLVWDDENKRLGINMQGTVPSASLDIHGSNTQLAQFNNKGAQSASGGAGMIGLHDAGVAMANGSRLGFMAMGGAKDDAHSMVNTVLYEAYATEDWTLTATGSKGLVKVQPNGTTGAGARKTAVTFDQDGKLILDQLTANTSLYLDANKKIQSNPLITAGTFNKLSVNDKGFVNSGSLGYYTLSGNPNIANATTGGTARYITFSDGNVQNTYNVRQIIFANDTTVKKLKLLTLSAQPATGSTVFTVLKNGIDTAITITIPAGSGAGVYTEDITSIDYLENDTISLKWVNNALTTSCTLGALSIGILC